MATPPAAATAACARAAFALAVGADGRVQRDGIRWLAWDVGGDEPRALARLQQLAAGSRWDVAGGGVAHVVLPLDCAGRSSGQGRMWEDLEASTQRSLRARRRAAAHMRRLTGAAWSENDLDCLWGNLEALRGGPFPYDDLDLSVDEASRLGAAATADGGVWVCRAARSAHQGQLVILDRALRLLAVGRYVLGE